MDNRNFIFTIRILFFKDFIRTSGHQVNNLDHSHLGDIFVVNQECTPPVDSCSLLLFQCNLCFTLTSPLFPYGCRGSALHLPYSSSWSNFFHLIMSLTSSVTAPQLIPLRVKGVTSESLHVLLGLLLGLLMYTPVSNTLFASCSY